MSTMVRLILMPQQVFKIPQLILKVMDEDLMQYDLVWGAAGTPQTVFPIAPEKLREVSGAKLGDVKQ